MAVGKNGTGSPHIKQDMLKLEDPLEALQNRTPEQIAEDRRRILANARKARPLPPGKTLEDVIVGALSDDKSEEEILLALAEQAQ